VSPEADFSRPQRKDHRTVDVTFVHAGMCYPVTDAAMDITSYESSRTARS